MSQEDFANVDQEGTAQDAELEETFICEGCKHEQDCTAMDGWVLHQQIAVCFEARKQLYKPEDEWIAELYGVEDATCGNCRYADGGVCSNCEGVAGITEIDDIFYCNNWEQGTELRYDSEIDMSDDARPSNEMMEHYKRTQGGSR